MKILVTGAGGFLGGEIVRRALARGHSVRATVRNPSKQSLEIHPAPETCALEMRDAAQFPAAVAGVEAVIHCAAVTSEGAPDETLSRAVNVEGTRRLYLAARQAGVKRWIQISSMSAHPGIRSVYGRTKLEADEFLRAQSEGLPAWTILRPSLIYGPGGRGLVDKTTRLMRKLPAIPVVGSGRELLRPVFVSDVADATLDCLEHRATLGRSYMLGGADEVTLNEFMQRLGEACGHPRPLVHLPLGLCHILAVILGIIFKNPPLTVDNILGVKDLAHVEHDAAIHDWGYAPAA